MNLKKQLHFNSHMGRMGNQMFQYACAKNLELRGGFVCSLDDISKLEYFELAPGERWKNRLKEKLFFHVAKRIYGMEVNNLQFEDMHGDFRAWLFGLKKPSMIWGYFQSESYFSESAAQIRQYFRVKKQYQSGFTDFLQKHGLEPGSYAAVHIRRTDYKNFTVRGLEGDDFTLPDSFYDKGMELLQDQFGGKIVIASDDAGFCKERYGTNPSVIISDCDAITDFQLLSHAAALLISNSTYAWWAAWLNEKATHIYCPKYFLGFKEHKEVPVNIYPGHWTQTVV
ncbi:MAG: alpha-1,2-fucosyltransferase [Chitinophagaceae bacterium]